MRRFVVCCLSDQEMGKWPCHPVKYLDIPSRGKSPLSCITSLHKKTQCWASLEAKGYAGLCLECFGDRPRACPCHALTATSHDEDMNTWSSHSENNKLVEISKLIFSREMKVNSPMLFTCTFSSWTLTRRLPSLWLEDIVGIHQVSLRRLIWGHFLNSRLWPRRCSLFGMTLYKYTIVFPFSPKRVLEERRWFFKMTNEKEYI